YGIMWEGMVTGLQEISTLNLYKLLQVVVNLISPIVALVILDAGLSGMLIVWLIGAILLTAARMGWVFHRVDNRMFWDSDAAKSAVHFGVKIYPAFLIAVLLSQMDVLFLNYFKGGRELGYYAVASAFAFRIELMGSSLTTAANARLTSGSREEVGLLLTSLLRRVIASG